MQRAAVDLLNATYEQDFLDCSYGFRPGRGPHDALDEVSRIICFRPISVILEADIHGYFDAIVRSLLTEMIEKRVSDGSILRLIGQSINVGVIEDGRLRSLKAITAWCREHRHDPVEAQQDTLNKKLRGHYQKYAGRQRAYAPDVDVPEWQNIAAAHEALYSEIARS